MEHLETDTSLCNDRVYLGGVASSARERAAVVPPAPLRARRLRGSVLIRARGEDPHWGSQSEGLGRVRLCCVC